jgi:hypothetical protein
MVSATITGYLVIAVGRKVFIVSCLIITIICAIWLSNMWLHSYFISSYYK